MVNTDLRAWCLVLLGAVLPLLPASGQEAAMRAFPGAEGFGAYARGGRGGRVLTVTNLADYAPGKDESVPGSLRAACLSKGPRIVLFRVSGTISLKSRLVISEPFLTIAGNTAPGEGICVKSHATTISTHNVIVRHVRFRPGTGMGMEPAALWIEDASDVVIDHCSAGWGRDGVLSVTGDSKNITVQWCIISESLHGSDRKLGRGSLVRIRDGRISFHHNLYAHNRGQNPEFAGYDGNRGAVVDFRNNVIYNWRDSAACSDASPVRIDFVGNYFKTGPSTKSTKYAFVSGGRDVKLHLSGNVLVHESSVVRGNDRMVRTRSSRSIVPDVFCVEKVTTQSAEEAYGLVLTNSGAVLPRRDSADKRVVETVRQRKGGLIDSQEDVGGWPLLMSSPAPVDSDGDGMPDSWELKHGFSKKRAGGGADSDKDGYSNLEEYVNGTDPRKPDPGRTAR